MQLKNYRVLFLSICLFLSSFSLVEAVHYKEITSVQPKTTISFKVQKKKFKTFLKAIFSKKPSSGKADDETIKKRGNWALGVSSIALLIFIIALAAAPTLLLVAIPVGILGFILCLRALRSIRKSEDPSRYSAYRFKAILGLIFSIASVLIVPLVILLIFAAYA